jgi:DNA repair exonuclease SbcCD ATPase subunit
MNRFSIKRVEIENFRSIQKKVVLDIKPGLYTIEGINNDEKGATNASGKSSLFSGIYWCLTGSPLTNETLADEVINDKAGKNCKVCLYISFDEGELKITRTRKDDELGNTLIVEMNGQDISCHRNADTQERLNQLIKIPFELLHSTIMMTHDIKSAFSELSPQQRIQTLESIRDYSIWDKVREEANKNIKEYNSKITENNLNISNVNGSLSTYSEMIDKDRKNLTSLQNSIDLTVLTERITKSEQDKKVLEDQILVFEKELAELKEKLNSVNNDARDELNRITEEANVIKSEVRDLEFSLKEVNSNLNLVEKWFVDDSCPTCGKKLDRTEVEIDQNKAKRTELLAKIEQINTKIKSKNTLLDEKRKQWTLINAQVKKDKENQTVLADEVSKKEQNIRKMHSDLTDLDRNITKWTYEVNFHAENVKKLEESIKSHEENIAKLTIDKTDFEKNNTILESKRQLSDYYYKLLGSKGELRPYLLNKDIQALNNYMQKYIHCFFRNTNVELKLNGASIDIKIDSLGVKKTVSRLSGGEKKRLDIAIQFALYDLLQSTSQIRFNLVCFDEIEAELDEVGIQQIIDMVEDKSSEIESVFWITNNSMVSESIPNKIICKKTLGVTTLEEV